MREVELKFLDIDVPSMTRRLLAIGATREFESEIVDAYYERKSRNAAARGSTTLRLRTLNGVTMITFKGPRQAGRMKVREEREVRVEGREQAHALLVALGYRVWAESRKRRVHFTLGQAAFELDTMAGIPTYLEVETKSEREMHAVCAKLGLRVQDGTGASLRKLYPHVDGRLKRGSPKGRNRKQSS